MSISLQKNCDLDGGLFSTKTTTPSIQAEAALQLLCREEWRRSARCRCATLTGTHPHSLRAEMWAKGGRTEDKHWKDPRCLHTCGGSILEQDPEPQRRSPN